MTTPTINRPLTPRMCDLVKAVARLTEQRGIPPTITEVAARMGLHPTRVAQLAVAAAARGGLVRDPRIPRSMRVPNPARR
jgi:hypothetical protein